MIFCILGKWVLFLLRLVSGQCQVHTYVLLALLCRQVVVLVIPLCMLVCFYAVNLHIYNGSRTPTNQVLHKYCYRYYFH